ncbi:MAG: hypothetical protein MJ141_01165 [Clostridia bacterium]|nr:hypothetical protein [Clostridia bacterium]
MELSQKDIAVLREVASKYMGYATLPVQDEKRRLWRCLNAGHMEKPLVTIDQMPWNELDVDGSLTCRVENPYFRRVEEWMRMETYKWEHLPVDMVLNPYILLPRPIRNTGYGVSNMVHTLATDPQNSVVASSLITSSRKGRMSRRSRIRSSPLTAIWKRTSSRRPTWSLRASPPVKMQGIIMHLGLWDAITQWMGVTNCYIELMDRPELMHAIMDRLTNAAIAGVKQINELGLYDINTNMCHAPIPSATSRVIPAIRIIPPPKTGGRSALPSFSPRSPRPSPPNSRCPICSASSRISARSIMDAATASMTGSISFTVCPASARSPAARGATGKVRRKARPEIHHVQ